MADSRDLLAVQEDALLLDLLSRRLDATGFADDPVAGLLQSLAEDVDADLPSVAPHWHEDIRVAAVASTGLITGAVARSRSSRRLPSAAVAAMTVTGLLFATGGVAAAVTGDPFSPLREVASAVWGDGSTNQSDPTADDGAPGPDPSKSLPASASDKAELNRMLVGVSSAIARGDVDAAAQQLALAQALADSGLVLPTGLQHRLDHLTELLADPTPGGHDGNKPAAGDNGKKPATGDNGKKPATGDKSKKPATGDTSTQVTTKGGGKKAAEPRTGKATGDGAGKKTDPAAGKSTDSGADTGTTSGQA